MIETMVYKSADHNQ